MVFDPLLSGSNPDSTAYHDNSSTRRVANKLPPELWTEIFLACLPEDPEKALPRPSLRHAPLLLTHVCGQWREIAQCTPALWSSVFLKFGPHRPEEDAALMASWLAHTGNRPLNIELSYDGVTKEAEVGWDPYPDDGSLVVHPVIDVVVPYAPRWRHIDFFLPRPFLKRLNEALYDRLPLLHSLALDVDCTVHWQQPIRAFSRAPSLRKLYIGSSIFPFLIDVPWAQLTEINIDLWSSNHFMRVLQSSPNLIDYTVNCVTPLSFAIHEQLMDDEYLAPSVTILSIGPISSETLHSTLGHITLPSLTSLTLGSAKTKSPRHAIWEGEVLRSFIVRSCCRLTRFSILRVAVNDIDLVGCLVAMSELVELEIYERSSWNTVTDGVLERMVCTTPVMVPQLRVLRMRGSLDFSDNALSGMLHARLGVAGRQGGAEVARLERLELDSGDPPSAQRILLLTECQQEHGLHVALSSGGTQYL